MKIYETRQDLRYPQIAFVLETENGYLCIGTEFINHSDKYRIGELVSVDELQNTNYKIENSPLFGTYLFTRFLETCKKNK